MGNQLNVRLWYGDDSHQVTIVDDILNFLRENLGKKKDELRVSGGCARLADMDHLVKRVLGEIIDIKDGIVVGIVPAQIHKECWGIPFSVLSGKLQVRSKEELESLVVCAGIGALYRSFAYSCTQHNQGRVMLVHVHPVFYEENFFEVAGRSLRDMWIGEDGIVSQVITMAKNQATPFVEMHIGEKWDDGMPSLVIEMGPKAIMVG